MPLKWTEARTFFADQSTPAAAAIAVGVAQGRGGEKWGFRHEKWRFK